MSDSNVFELSRGMEVLTWPDTYGSPFNHHSGWGLMTSPKTSRNWGSTFTARTILLKTELESFSLFLTCIINAAHAEPPIIRAPIAKGHLDYRTSQVKEPCETKWIINLHPREFSRRRVIRVVWPRSWCFRESLDYRLTRWKRWSWKLCSETSSRRVCNGSPFQSKSGRSKSTVQSGRHLRQKAGEYLIHCQYGCWTKNIPSLTWSRRDTRHGYDPR